MDREDIERELAFWDEHLVPLVIDNIYPRATPPNRTVRALLKGFRQRRDYHAVMHRANALRWKVSMSKPYKLKNHEQK